MAKATKGPVGPTKKALQASEVAPTTETGEQAQRTPMQNVISILRGAGEDIAAEFEGHAVHSTNALRAKSVLDRLVDQFALQSGNVSSLTDARATEGQGMIQKKVATIAGKPFQPRRASRGYSSAELDPQQPQIRTLQERVDAATDAFPYTPTEEILKDWDQLIVRGVARKAHVQVTSSEPAVITEDWVDMVKQAVIANQVKQGEGTGEENTEVNNLEDLNEQQ